MPAGMKFCGNCGAALPQESSDSSAERRQLTVVFVDLVGSTALSESLDPEELRDLYTNYQSECARIIRRYDGHVAQYLGDGILAYFGYPIAREDNAARAVHSGLEILEAMSKVDVNGQRPHVRVGIHTGLVVVGDVGSGEKREQLALGETPNIAARIQGEAQPDTVFVSEPTRRLISGHFKVEDLGERALKGITKPMRVFRVIRANDSTTRFAAVSAGGMAPFVGREHELESVRSRWQQSKNGAGQTLILRAEAGMGKSRLAGAAKEFAATGPHELFEAQCSPYHAGSALYPIVDMLARRLLFESAGSPEAKLAALDAFLAGRRINTAEAMPLVAPLFGLQTEGRYAPSDLPAERHRKRTLDMLADLLLRSGSADPVLVLIEDLHWADPSTMELLGLVISRQAMSRAMVVCTTRPEGVVARSSAPNVTEIVLQALARQDTQALIAGVVGRKPLPQALTREIVDRTAGVPLFVEAVVRTIVESGVLRELEDRYELIGPMPAGLIPATVHDSLMARIDRLRADKSVAQLASTIGREFTFELLQHVSGRDEESLRRALEHITELDLISRVGIPPRATYTFKHALMQDAAYESLLRKTRQEYHGRIATALLEHFPETAETKPELLARHFEGAGHTSDAIDYWMKAGFQAQERSAVEECVGHLRKAIALLSTLPEDDPDRIQKEMNAQLALAPALMATRGWGAREVEIACNRARDLCERANNGQGLLAALWGLWTVLFVRGEHGRALAEAKTVLDIALATDVKILHVAARHGIGYTHFFRGEFEEARFHAEKALEIFDLEQEKELVRVFQIPSTVCCLAFLTMSLRLTGHIDQAAKRLRELEDLVQALANPACTSVGLGIAMYFYLDTRDVPTVAAKADQGYSLSVQKGFAFWADTMRVYSGWAEAMQGDASAAVPRIRSAIDDFVNNESGIYVPTMYMMVADALRAAGDPEAALDSLRTALRIAGEQDELYYTAEFHRNIGEIELGLGNTEHAERSFRAAIDIARGQGARLLELRAALLLARMLANAGERDEARALLEPLDAWFTEGRDSPELRDLRTTLDALVAGDSVSMPA